jgi:hypothetical protein
MAVKPFASELQKERFKVNFEEIVKDNESLNNKYSIQFFDTGTKSNYVIKGLDGKSLNVLSSLSIEELEKYRLLKLNWQG